jgi:hypothetical protein
MRYDSAAPMREGIDRAKADYVVLSEARELKETL